jgi:hypothetical protein
MPYPKVLPRQPCGSPTGCALWMTVTTPLRNGRQESPVPSPKAALTYKALWLAGAQGPACKDGSRHCATRTELT